MNKKVVLGIGSIIVILGVALGVGLYYMNAPDDKEETHESALIVNIPGQGRVSGIYGTTNWSNETFMQFLNIPYAESPTGPLRFKAPVPRLPWSHIEDGTKFGRACPAMDTSNPNQDLTTDLAEDCLSIAVYTKSFNASSPVIFLIVGGAFVHGDSAKYRAEYLLTKDIVLVVVQYRLGPLGFISLNTPDLPGNMALDDAIMALKWVQKHIHNFGGDKNRVTMMGQSAGSWLASVLLISPKTENTNLFHRVIMQSGQILSKYSQDPDPVEQTQRFCRNLNCEDCLNPDKIYQCLMTKTLSEYRDATANEKFEPKIENQLGIMPQHPFILLENYNRTIPILLGFQKHDAAIALTDFYRKMKTQWGSYDSKTVRQFAQKFLESQGDYSGVSNDVLLRLTFDKTPGLLDTNDHHQALPAYFDIANIVFLKSSVTNMAKRMAAKKIGSENMANIFLYTFDYLSDIPAVSRQPWKNIVPHSMNNVYMFPLRTLVSDKDIFMAQQMISLWTSFVTEGVPQQLDGTQIKPMKTETGPYFHIDYNIVEGNDVLKELTICTDDPNKNFIINENVPF